ncbi:hypothetical protein KC19_3G062400 [Ceratodon purpureus]|uniref:Protein kinase domain-containing protein n=1 Tax=Ceratodon purpureus TaxID=3225 RepID=A0A8T0IFH2_CERPU|nr:hypothetical protein KC19_3G062400 [Ceratodon purpureus]
MLQVAKGVNYLHKNRVVHRDLKSHNILVMRMKCRDGKEFVCAKLADFGLSKTKETSTTFSNQTLNTGTTRWMAPELMGPQTSESQTSTSRSDEIKYPFKCDVYSFGMVCFEILTGEVPFQSTSSPNAVKRMVLDGKRPILPNDCPNYLKDLIQSCWKSDASIRPSFGDICVILKTLKWSLITKFQEI